MCDGGSYVRTHDDFYVKDDVEIRSVAGSFSSCFHDAETIFDCSYDEEDINNREIHSDQLFKEDLHVDQHVLNEYFHNDSCDFMSNHMLKCEEVVVCV